MWPAPGRSARPLKQKPASDLASLTVRVLVVVARVQRLRHHKAGACQGGSQGVVGLRAAASAVRHHHQAPLPWLPHCVRRRLQHEWPHHHTACGLQGGVDQCHGQIAQLQLRHADGRGRLCLCLCLHLRLRRRAECAQRQLSAPAVQAA